MEHIHRSHVGNTYITLFCKGGGLWPPPLHYKYIYLQINNIVHIEGNKEKIMEKQVKL